MAKPRAKRGASAADPRIPDKQYFRIGEVAEIAEVESYVLRFWETEFPSLAPAKTKSGRRNYGRDDVIAALRIRDLLYEEGYTIAGARRQIGSKQGASSGIRGSSAGDSSVSSSQMSQMSARTRGLLRQVRKEAAALLQLVEE